MANGITRGWNFGHKKKSIKVPKFPLTDKWNDEHPDKLHVQYLRRQKKKLKCKEVD